MTAISKGGEPTARGDDVAGEVRQWYERHRESWFDRHSPFGVNRKHGSAFADEFMLRLVAVAVAADAGKDVNDGTWDY